MKKLLVILPSIILFLSLQSVALEQRKTRQVESVEDKDVSILYDFRKDSPIDKIPKLAPEIQKKVLSALFSSYHTKSDDCKPVKTAADVDQEGRLAVARERGQVVPEIVSMARGSFTASGVQEVLYLVHVNECNASHADHFGSSRLAIFSDGELVANFDGLYSDLILGTYDLDQNGKNELLLSSSDGNQGIFVTVAQLVEIVDGQLKVLYDFGQIEQETCGAYPLVKKGTITASVIFYILPIEKGKLPEFQIRNYRAVCSRKGQNPVFKYFSTGKLEEE